MVAHQSFMRLALELAQEARRLGEVPVGAVIVVDGRVAGAGHNRPIASNDPTAHAEIVAMREASARLGNYRLSGATLYVTVEPCLMCVGAMVHARIAMLVYGAPEPKAGAVASTQRAHEHAALNHRIEVVSGVLENESRALMQEFFREQRSFKAEGQTPKAEHDRADVKAEGQTRKAEHEPQL
jgi:tRNA(adenine34) deaminase